MKWVLLIVFTFISGQAFSEVEFEKVHQLAFDSQIEEAIVIMKPLEQKRLAPLYTEFHVLQDRTIAAKK